MELIKIEQDMGNTEINLYVHAGFCVALDYFECNMETVANFHVTSVPCFENDLSLTDDVTSVEFSEADLDRLYDSLEPKRDHNASFEPYKVKLVIDDNNLEPIELELQPYSFGSHYTRDEIEVHALQPVKRYSNEGMTQGQFDRLQAGFKCNSASYTAEFEKSTQAFRRVVLVQTLQAIGEVDIRAELEWDVSNDFAFELLNLPAEIKVGECLTSVETIDGELCFVTRCKTQYQVID